MKACNGFQSDHQAVVVVGRIKLNTVQRGLAAAVLTLCGMSLTLLTLGVGSSNVNAQPLRTGVNGVFESEPPNFQHVADAGARFVLIPALWDSIAPAKRPNSWQPSDPADPNYNWSSVDSLVIGVVQAGLTPVLMTYGAPIWAQRCDVGHATTVPSCNPDPTMFAAFATAAARRYSGQFDGLPRVRYWQGFNEPNLSIFFTPQFEGRKAVSPTLYRALLNAFYFAVKSVNRSNLVLAAGLGPVAVPKYTIGPMRFARQLLCMTGRHHPHPTHGSCEGGVHFDIFDIHPYTTGGPKHSGGPDDVELGSLGRLQELLAAADRAGRIKGRFRHTPLWATEFAWDSKPPDPHGLAMKTETRWTAEAMFRFWSAGVSHVFWYQIRDPAGPPYQSGLYFRGPTPAEDRPKELLYAFRFPFVSYSRKSGFFFWGRTPTSTGGKITIQVLEAGKWRNATVTRASASGIFEGVAEGSYGRHKQGTVRALYRGEGSVPFSLRPVKEFHQPPFG